MPCSNYSGPYIRGFRGPAGLNQKAIVLPLGADVKGVPGVGVRPRERGPCRGSAVPSKFVNGL